MNKKRFTIKSTILAFIILCPLLCIIGKIATNVKETSTLEGMENAEIIELHHGTQLVIEDLHIGIIAITKAEYIDSQGNKQKQVHGGDEHYTERENNLDS